MDTERTYYDMRKWNPLIGKTFYERNPNNPTEIRTYYMNWNGFANKIVPAISNWVAMEPTPEMEPYNQRVMTAVATFQNQQTWFR